MYRKVIQLKHKCKHIENKKVGDPIKTNVQEQPQGRAVAYFCKNY